MLRLLIIPLALLVLLAGAMAWSGSATAGRSDFVFINRGDIITLDPNQMSYLQDIRIAHAMWEGLFTYDPKTLDPIPGVAAGPAQVSDDKRVYTFTLRDNAKWSNGDPVTSNDFVFAWRRMLESPGEYTYLLYYIKGAEQYVADFAANNPADFKTVGIEALDPRTFRVTLNDPVAFFYDLCAFPTFLPLHKPSMDKFARVDEQTGRTVYDGKFTRPPHVVSNGPYELKRWDFKTRLVLEKNPHYWDKDNVKCESIEMAVVDDALTQLLRYESGSVDWIASVPTEIAADMKKQGRPDLKSFGAFGTTYLSFMIRPKLNSGANNPLADIRVRMALCMAVDKKQITETITRMGEETASTFVPPGVFDGYQTMQGIPFDRARAKKLMAEAGYGKGGMLPGVSYIFRSDLTSSREMAQTLARQWKQVLNIDMPLESAERKNVRQRINDRDYTISAADWYGDYGDPSTFTDKYRSNSENNDSEWKSAKFDALVLAATKEADVAKRLRLLEQAEQVLLSELPIFPLYHPTNQYLFRDYVKGINIHPRNMTMFKGVEVVRRGGKAGPT